jgi:hypothetical protein
MVMNHLIVLAVLFSSSFSWAAHPLITDDSGTQGKGKFQLEVNGQYDSDKETDGGATIKTTGGQTNTTLSYGIVDNADVVFSLPYAWSRVNDGTTVSDAHGISDAVVEIKWRFFEKEGLSFAVKPGVSFPTGNEDKGLGAGKIGYHVFLIGSKEAAPWTFHVNLGYIRNETKADIEEKNLWHASFAATYEVIKDFKIVGDIGAEKNPDKSADNDPAFLILGGIYSLSENFDIDAGVKRGLTSSETDFSLMAGMTYRF